MRSSTPDTPRVILRARRVCLACEFEHILEEPEGTDEIGTPCDRCHAPTERVTVLARRIVTRTVDPHAAALGRRGGLKGGPARAAALSPKRRREIAQAAARARWRSR